MISYAQETQHEKIIRGLAIGIALVRFGNFNIFFVNLNFNLQICFPFE